jgi:hypothetical protein
MRSDMAKVIVERPRKNGGCGTGGKGYKKELARLGWENAPRREGMKARTGGGTKYFNEHLGPLRRYLETNIGRPWNKVFSEICETINRNSAVQDHVRDHVFDYVVIHVVLIDGVPCSGEGGYRQYGQPLFEYRGHRRFYVCPRTGLLRRVPPLKRSRPPQPPRPIRVDKDHTCCWLRGAWHLVSVDPFPEVIGIGAMSNNPTSYDPIQKQGITRNQARQLYGAEVVGVSCRQLSKREMRQLPIPIDLQR